MMWHVMKLISHAIYTLCFQITDTDGARSQQWSNRSLPSQRHNAKNKVVGVYIDSEGPLHLHGITFKGFKNDDNTEAMAKYCGIAFKDEFNFGMGASSSVKGRCITHTCTNIIY